MYVKDDLLEHNQYSKLIHEIIFSKRKTILFVILIGLTTLIAACGNSEIKTPNSPSSIPSPEGSERTTTDVLPKRTATGKPTETKTVATTEIPIFTDAEVKAGSPFDALTFPTEFQKCAKNLLDCTDQQLNDYDAFLKAIRADKGIAETASYVEQINSGLPSVWNGVRWISENLSKVVEEQLVLRISRDEYRIMSEEARKVIEWDEQDGNRLFQYGFEKSVGIVNNPVLFWSSANLGSVLGLPDFDSGRISFTTASGELVGVAQIEDESKNTLVLLIQMKDKDGYYVLVPIIVNFDKKFTLPKGTKCLPYNTKKTTCTLSKDVQLGSLKDFRNKVIAKEDIFQNIGNMISISSYFSSLYHAGFSDVFCFSPDLNLEMGGLLQYFSNYPGNSSPWTK